MFYTDHPPRPEEALEGGKYTVQVPTLPSVGLEVSMGCLCELITTPRLLLIRVCLKVKTKSVHRWGNKLLQLYACRQLEYSQMEAAPIYALLMAE
ncbi:hypothetical protein NDU88_006924 [Pleurodeles waltl]|uniref:Uncharacterized protein n=1 Tax=Pleurodeles waltl TaxID=8319 RepID=A0AAV7TYH9_PLEWA|nr:hypothetical protein NDU88_006924 [Pleurodeles waltl]